MKPLRAAVVGVGHLGGYHAQKYARCPGVELTAVVDTDAVRARQVAAESGARVYSDHRELIGNVDLASVVVPTSSHYEVARDLLQAGIHVLVEKPITATIPQGRDLVNMAEAYGCVLQVGHLERFNPVMEALAARVEAPMFIECYRIAPFGLRGTDVDVVLDLMIHDIDLILTLVRSPVERIHANGAPILSAQLDIANARIQFASGCVANLTASRVSQKRERSMRIFQPNAYLSADFYKPTLDIYRKMREEVSPGIPDIRVEHLELEPGDALDAEIHAFVGSVRNGSPPLVSGLDGLQALQTANEIVRQLHSHPLSERMKRATLAS